MKFLNFEFIPLMLLPSFILLYLVLTNKSMIERIFDSELLSKLKLEQGLSKEFRITLLFLALSMMILAMARPVYQRGVVEVESRRANLVVALDISRSMKAKDYYPNRLEFAKKKIEELIDKEQNLRIGLIAFAKDAFIVSPITSDKEALKYLLKRLNTRSLSLKGTNILAALMSAKLLFGQKNPKHILLITDGGDKKDFSKEIEYAKKERFRVDVLAVATKKGAPIEENGQLLKDQNGQIVITRLNENIAKLAKATGGLFLQATLDQSDIDEILKSISGVQKEHKTEKIIDQVEFYPYLLWLALLFLFMAFFSIPSRAAAMMVLLIGYQAHAGLVDFKIIDQAKKAYESGDYKEAAKKFEKIAKSKQSPQSYYDWGNALYKLGLYKEALKAYSKVQTQNKELEFQKLHNIGNCFFKLGQYKKAIEMYQKALAIKEDKDTRFNLELAKKMLQKKKKPQQKKQSPNKQKPKQKGKKSEKKNGQQQKRKEKSPEQKNGQKSGQKGEQESQRQPISDREEKKWLKMIEKNEGQTLLYKAPIKNKKESGNENPW